MNNLTIVCGIDIGGTNTDIGFIRRDGECIQNISIKTNTRLSADEYFKEISEVIKNSMASVLSNYELMGIGIGAPNANYLRNTIKDPPNLPWGVVDVQAIMDKHFDLPFVIMNDAKAAAVGEMFFGSAKGLKNFIVITLGTGLGSGIILNGQLINGQDGFAGEFGHSIYKEDGRQCNCGLKGCLETYVSATGIVHTAKELLLNTDLNSKLRYNALNSINSKMIYETALDHDELALNTFELTGKALGTQLAILVSVTNPDTIFLLGGLAGARNLIIEPTKKFMKKNLFAPFKNKVKILNSGLNNVNAAVMGISAVIWEKLENTQNVFLAN